jgi:pyrroline-5-carboxylate reductase
VKAGGTKMTEFGFIGVGNMGGALASAVCKKVGGENVRVSDYSAEKAEAFAKNFGCRAVDNEEIASHAKFIFLGVKPQVLPSVVESLRPVLSKRTKGDFILVTMAAGISMAALEEMLGFSAPFVRIMPNTPVAVGKGMILYTANEAVSENDLSEFVDSLSFAGKTDYIKEEEIDAASVISGCGPAFMYMFLEAMQEKGIALGLDGEKARLYAQQTMLGAASLAMASEESLETLRVRVCSPGGSTIEGVKVFQSRGLYGTVSEALGASFKRTKELGNKK